MCDWAELTTAEWMALPLCNNDVIHSTRSSPTTKKHCMTQTVNVQSTCGFCFKLYTLHNAKQPSALCLMLYHNTYSESSLSRRVLMVSAQVASSVCMRCEIVWYVFEFSLSSITPCNSKSEYSFWKIFGNRTTVFKLGSNSVQFSKYQALITVMGTLNNTVMTHLVLKCSKLLNTDHVSCGVSQQKRNVLHMFTHNTVKLFLFSSLTSMQKLLYTAVLWQVQSWGFRSPGMWHCDTGRVVSDIPLQQWRPLT